MAKSARDPRVTRYIKARAPFARPVLTHLRRTIHAAAAGLDETIKWGMPSFEYQGKIVCGIAGFKTHCALWFWNRKAVIGKKAGEGMGSFGRITSIDDLPAPATIRGYVRKAVTLIDRKRRAALRGAP